MNGEAVPGLSDAHVASLTAEIDGSRTAYDVFKILKSLAATYGLDQFFVTKLQDMPDGDIHWLAILTNWDSDFQHDVRESGVFRTSRVLRSVAKARLPVSVHFPTLLREQDDPDEISALKMMIDGGHEAYVFLPVTVDALRTGGVSFSGRRPAVTQPELMQLSFYGQHIFHRMMELRDQEGQEPSANMLTGRELECLRLTADGLTAAQCAREIGITVHTVNYHLNNAGRKLEGRNKIHAIAKAMRAGLI